MAATARLMWLCACLRYWPDGELVFECATCFYCFFPIYLTQATRVKKLDCIIKNKKIFCKKFPCIRLARGKFELTNQDSAGGKNVTVITSMKVNGKGVEIRQLFSLEMAFNKIGNCKSPKGDLQFPKTIPHCKKWKIGNILCLPASNLAPKIVGQVCPCRIIVVLLWTKCAVRRQIKPGLLSLIIKRGQCNSPRQLVSFVRPRE